MDDLISTKEFEVNIETLETIAASIDDVDIIDNLFYVTEFIKRLQEGMRVGYEEEQEETDEEET